MLTQSTSVSDSSYDPSHNSSRTTSHTSSPTDSSSAFVSVIIRSLGRERLHDALASVARQLHRNIEVVIVDATGGNHPPLPSHCGDFSMRIVSMGRALNRPQAANVGIDHARGEWMIFLDDDDFFDADHIVRLLAIASQHGTSVAYAGTRLLDNNDRVIGVLNARYSRLGLVAANHMQMGAVLFHRRLLAKGCRFDEAMLLYQDWDFWLQLSIHTHFAHSTALTNNWRIHTGQSGAGTGGNANIALQNEFNARVKAKWEPMRERLVNFVHHAVRFSNHEIARGKPLHAKQVLQRAIAVTPNDPSLINLLGVANFRAGDVAGAWDALCEAQAMLPDNQAIRRNLAQVAQQKR
jgi:glycosyltransferase involved in cell wall biosynthesis